jgi:hypothetical protein
LQYTIKRNLQHFKSLLATICTFKQDGKIKNTYFKSNGLATTKFRTEDTLTENADILVIDLDDAILSPYTFETELVASFEDVKSLLDKMQIVNVDKSIGGFIRCMDNQNRVIKGYAKKLEYDWNTAVLKITGEIKKESDYLEITSNENGLIIINEVGYELDIIKPLELRTENEKIQILDSRGVGLTNFTNFKKVSVNSEIFSNIVQLSDKLLSL